MPKKKRRRSGDLKKKRGLNSPPPLIPQGIRHMSHYTPPLTMTMINDSDPLIQIQENITIQSCDTVRPSPRGPARLGPLPRVREQLIQGSTTSRAAPEGTHLGSCWASCHGRLRHPRDSFRRCFHTSFRLTSRLPRTDTIKPALPHCSR